MFFVESSFDWLNFLPMAAAFVTFIFLAYLMGKHWDK